MTNSPLTPGIVPGRLPAAAYARNFDDHTPALDRHEAQVAADFTGSSSGLPRGTTIVASATGSEATIAGGLHWPTARARIVACVYGSERFAESFAVSLNRVRRRL